MHFRTVALLILSTFGFAMSVHCGDTTGHERTTFSVRARGIPVSTSTSTGWTLRYTTARIQLGPLRWYEGEPLFGQYFSLPSFGTAHAHPGHYVAGEAIADILDRRVVDLLSPDGVEIGTATGVTATANSATVELAPSSELSGATIFVQGEAQKEAQIVRFSVSAAFETSVRGVAARGIIDGRQARWELQIDLRSLLDRADFSQLTGSPNADGFVHASEDSQISNALYRAVHAGSSYRFVAVSVLGESRSEQ